jgi:tetratricopeptide (TPR) repeat protein
MAQMTSMRLGASTLAVAVAMAIAGPVRAQAVDPQLQQAREAAWAGRTGEALHLLDDYLAQHPDDADAQLDRATYLAWTGDYAKAIETLDRSGRDDAAARQLRARISGWDGRRDAAMALSAPAYEAAPDDYDNAWTQALAARLGQRPEQALPALDKVLALKPDAKDSLELAKIVRLPMYSSVSLPLSRYSDSDDIETFSYGIDADLRLSDAWRLLAGSGRREHSAPAAGPFAPLNGGDELDETRTYVGARYAASPKAAFEFAIGSTRLGGDNGFSDSDSFGRAQFSYQASDAFGYTLSATRDRVASSPRALSAGITSNGASASLRWRPGMRDSVYGSIALDDYNDGNNRHMVALDWRHAVYRGSKANVDLGAQADWLGYSRSPGNGYYSPDRYQRLAPTIKAYFKLGDEAGLELSAAVGVQRDETFDNWKRASDVGAVLTVGILTHWQLVGSIGYSERINEFGRYDGTNAGLTLRYRF